MQNTKYKMHNQLTYHRPLIVCLILIASFAQQQQTSAAPSLDKVRVLVVHNEDRQHALEEAAALSLDTGNSTSQLESKSSGDYQTGSGNSQSKESKQSNSTTTTTTDLHHSLAALELGQRVNVGGKKQQETTTTTTTTTTRVMVRKPELAPLNEIELPRSKPSWLNVSSRFKITGSSIEEIEYLFPAEYYLRQAFDAPVLLKTKLGILEGVRSIKFNKHLYTFLSVPYARPPVDELRFKAPLAVDKWEGIMQATKWPPFCVQPSMSLASKSSPVHPLSQMMSEDCLYLNIWSPSLKTRQDHKRRPVMVWLHGGAFQYGGSSVDENDGSALALAGDVVVVTLNYRISAFGFLNANNKDNGPNNVGLLDQRLAMQWVQQNIKQFGGDPQQVTLFGESAGGHSVGLHMISPGSQPFFKRAILQSGVPISFLRSYDVNADNKGAAMSESISSVMMAKRLKCYIEPQTLVTTTMTSSLNESLVTVLNGEEPAGDSNLTSSADQLEGEQDANLGNTNDDTPILSDETLSCMRKKSSLEILKAMGAPGNSGFFPTGNDLKGFFPNGPITDSFDGENLKVGPQKDYLLGTNVDEGTFMLHYGMPALFPSRSSPRVSSIEELKLKLQAEIERLSREVAEQESADRTSNSSQAADIRSASGSSHGGAQAHLYRPLMKASTSVLESFMPKSQVRVLENGTIVGNTSVWSKEIEFGRAVGSLITDIIFLCPARTLARTLSEAGRNVYFYLYSHRSSLSPYHDWIGVTHHDEVEFVFGRPLRLADVYSGKDIEMSQRLMKIWSHFAHTGQALPQMNVEWPKYGIEDNNYMNLVTGQASVGQRYHDRVCNVYDTVISVHLRDT